MIKSKLFYRGKEPVILWKKITYVVFKIFFFFHLESMPCSDGYHVCPQYSFPCTTNNFLYRYPPTHAMMSSYSVLSLLHFSCLSSPWSFPLTLLNFSSLPRTFPLTLLDITCLSSPRNFPLTLHTPVFLSHHLSKECDCQTLLGIISSLYELSLFLDTLITVFFLSMILLLLLY